MVKLPATTDNFQLGFTLEASRLFTQPFIQTQIKENIKAPRHWPLCGEFSRGRWIPRTNGQYRGKWFDLMTSSWGRVRIHMEATPPQTALQNTPRVWRRGIVFHIMMISGFAFLSLSWIICWTNSRVGGDSRRHDYLCKIKRPSHLWYTIQSAINSFEYFDEL